MNHKPDSNPDPIDVTISRRTGVGYSSSVSGWQYFLSQFLEQMGPYLQPGKIITFQHLLDQEIHRFEEIVSTIHISDDVCGVYLPPSVRNQMLYTNRGKDIPASEFEPADDGAVLFTRPLFHDTIVNVLLAHLPCTPAVDVYDQGALLAGYVYDSIEDCLSSLEKIIQTHMNCGRIIK
ncbi:MAG: hypothetical protein KGY38_05010 [Desulfobacterales bacterium]|nr:hypothetical protein [Desulfobacterales bacterium]MBS3809495.1 hypothetical protein [Desulfobacterales bacterium]